MTPRATPAARAAVKPARLLILGGTNEAAALAEAVLSRFGKQIRVTTSLAGRTKQPRAVAGELRVGGFGGADGLADYLRLSATDLVIDATHPFAARISAAAHSACAGLNVPRLVLDRPAWRPGPQDRWQEVEDAAEAARLLPALGGRVFLTVGRRDLAPFAAVTECWFLVRLIEMPETPLPFHRPDRFETIAARGPFTIESERRLMAKHRIEVLVTKASGGEATAAKLRAARELELPVLLLRRPALEPGDRARSLDEALTWLAQALERLDAAAGRSA